MNVLVIGGNRFMGVELVTRLLAQGHRVTLLNRGSLVDPFGAQVQRVLADRGTEAFDAALANARFDAVVDFALFDGAQAERLERVLSGKVGHLIAISTGQVYLVRPPRPAGLAREEDYHGRALTEAPTADDFDNWKYGVDKRAMEDVLARGPVPYTTFRLPMVHGSRDFHGRLPGLFGRLVRGEPIPLRAPGQAVRHVFSGAVVDQVLASLARGPTQRAWNLAWDEPLTVAGLVERAARQLGVAPRIVEDENASRDDCFLNARWMSALDASAARRELGFVHPPSEVWLPQVFSAWLARL